MSDSDTATAARDFIREAIAEDLSNGRFDGRFQTRFPPRSRTAIYISVIPRRLA